MDKTFHVYVDFDFTLYDTKRFAADLRQAIAAQSSVTIESLGADAHDHDAHPTLGGYDFATHMAAHGLDPTFMWGVLDTLTHEQYLYDDSIKFIRTLRANGYDPRILSFGERRFQEAKIRPVLATLIGGDSKTQEQPLGFEIVFRPKYEQLASIHPDGHGVLVDDIPDQHLPTGFTEIHLDRKHPVPRPSRRTGGYTVSDLAQAYQVIQELYTQA